MHCGVKLASLGAALIALAACAAPDRQPDLDNLAINVEQTREGDFGEFLYNLNRFNVATSRAKCAVIVVANEALFTPDCVTPRQMELANALCRYREVAQVVA